MAKQESILKFRGSLGDLTFTKHRIRGYEVRVKNSISKERVLTDPNFQRMRENMSEFGRAAKKAKQIRQQLGIMTRGTADFSMRNRLMSLIHRIQKRDTENARGARVFQPKNAVQLRGFEFNSSSTLSQLFTPVLNTTYNRSAGVASLTIPTFDPQIDLYLLQGATHVRISLAVAQLADTEEMLPRPIIVASDYIPLIGRYEGSELVVQLPVTLPDVVYSLVGLSVYQQVNGDYYPLNDGVHNALCIAEVYVPEE